MVLRADCLNGVASEEAICRASSVCFFEEREVQIVCGVLVLALIRAAGDGQAFPTRERHRVFD